MDEYILAAERDCAERKRAKEQAAIGRLLESVSKEDGEREGGAAAAANTPPQDLAWAASYKAPPDSRSDFARAVEAAHEKTSRIADELAEMRHLEESKGFANKLKSLMGLSWRP